MLQECGYIIGKFALPYPSYVVPFLLGGSKFLELTFCFSQACFVSSFPVGRFKDHLDFGIVKNEFLVNDLSHIKVASMGGNIVSLNSLVVRALECFFRVRERIMVVGV